MSGCGFWCGYKDPPLQMFHQKCTLGCHPWSAPCTGRSTSSSSWRSSHRCPHHIWTFGCDIFSSIAAEMRLKHYHRLTLAMISGIPHLHFINARLQLTVSHWVEKGWDLNVHVHVCTKSYQLARLCETVIAPKAETLIPSCIICGIGTMMLLYTVCIIYLKVYPH